jgi:hypothetical protein
MDRHPEILKKDRLFEGRQVALLFWDRFRKGTG